MRALIVSAYPPPVPGSDVNGGYRRFGMFVQAIAQISDSIEFLYFIPPGDHRAQQEASSSSEFPSLLSGVPLKVSFVPRCERQETAWKHYGAGIFSLLEQPGYFSFSGGLQVERLSACLDRAPDLVFVAGLPCMSAFLPLKRRFPPIFFDINDIDHLLLMRTILTRPLWPGKFVNLLQIPAVIAAERRCIKISANSFVCSDLDVQHLRHLGAGPRVVSLPNAVPIPTAATPVSSEPTLLFLGFFGYDPNVDAANRLIKNIFPLIRRKLPLARLIIAGKLPERIPSYNSSQDGVEFAGFVDDLAALYRRSRAICCPIVNGGGTRVKLVEAASYAKPIVATSIGAEGLSLVDGSEILIRETDQEIAQACIELLTNDDLCAQLGAAARHKAQSLYDVDNIRSRITSLMQKAVGQPVTA